MNEYRREGGKRVLDESDCNFKNVVILKLVFGAKLKNDGTSPIESLKRGGVRRGLS